MLDINMTSNRALISVIVPVYNVEPYLDRCIQSIVNQSYTDLEIILVDDGSQDNCPAICDNWARRDHRIMVIHKKNGGLSDARNSGLAIATGEYIAFVDSDDWIDPDLIITLLSAIRKDHSEVAVCTVEMVWEDSTPNQLLTVHINKVLDRFEAQKALLEETLLKQPVWGKLYRCELLKGIPFEVGKQHEDVYWSYQVIGNAEHVSLIKYIGYYYTQRATSIMGQGYTLQRLDVLSAYEKREEYMAEHFPELVSQARISIYMSCIYHGQMSLKYLSSEDRKQALSYLESVKRKYPLRRELYRNKKMTYRLWLDLARLSLIGTCYLRNWFGVGM